VPYADFMKGISYIPSGELTYRGHSPGSTLPEGYKMEDLRKMAEGSSFDELNAMSEKDIANLEAGFGKIGKSLGLSPASDGADGVRASTFSGPLSNFGPSVTNFFSGVGNALGFADGGGVVPRQGYEEGGMPLFLRKAESGDDFSADNNLGYVGRGQFGEARLLDAKRAGVIPPDLTMEQFKSDPEIQKAVEAWHVSDVNNYIKSRGLGEFVGQKINDIPVTDQGLLAVAHLGGKGGMRKFLQSGGEYDPADVNGTKLSDYLMMASNVPGGVAPEVVPADVSGVAPTVDMPAVNALAIDAPEVSGVIPPMQDVFAQAQVSPVADKVPARKRTIIESILNQDMSDQARTGMLAAGLAMLGGTSPYAGVNIGKGGLAGLQAYYKGLENQRENAVKRAEIERTIAEARSTGATGGVTEQNLLMNVRNDYLIEAIKYIKKNKPYPSWEEYLAARGYGDMGWGSFDPTIMLQETPATETTPSNTTGNETPAPGSTPETGGEETAVVSTPNEPFVQNNAPSNVIKPTDNSEDIPNTMPNQNPAMLILQGTPEALAQLKVLRDQGFVTDLDNRRIPIVSTKEMETRQELNTGINTQFSKLQNEIPAINSVLNEISKVLQGFETTKLTDLQGKVSGLIYRVTGNRESLENATAADLLDKLFKQLSLVSQLGGEAGAAGIEKIKQIEGASGTSTMSAPALRDILGKAKALNEWNQSRIEDWGKFVDKNKASGISESMRNNWLKAWGEKLDAYYVPKNIADTPVKDNSLWKKVVVNGREQYDAKNFKEGWQYVMPNGKIARYTREDGKIKFIPVEQQ